VANGVIDEGGQPFPSPTAMHSPPGAQEMPAISAPTVADAGTLIAVLHDPDGLFAVAAWAG
jgi:hypothetical protein